MVMNDIGNCKYIYENGILSYSRIERDGFMCCVCIDLDTVVKELEYKDIDYEFEKSDEVFVDKYNFLIIDGFYLPVIYVDGYKEVWDRGFIKAEHLIDGDYGDGVEVGGFDCLSRYIANRFLMGKFSRYILSKYDTLLILEGMERDCRDIIANR